MVLKTRSWSLFTVTRRSSPNDVMVKERVPRDADEHKGGVEDQPDETALGVGKRRSLAGPGGGLPRGTCLWRFCEARDESIT